MTKQSQFSTTIPIWTYAYGEPESIGKIKTRPSDFIVEEQLPFQPSGSGEHAFLQIEKKGENTEYVARLLARFAGVRQRDIGYAGLKDRHAITTQWFSVWMPGRDDLDWVLIETENIKVLQATRHLKKLKRGVLSGNKFQLLIRDWLGNKALFEEQLQQIKEQGFPNYFGLQRFGREGQNINKALSIFEGTKVKREQRGIYLSATRSYLFNQMLAERVKENNWSTIISGDVLIFDRSNSYFQSNSLDEVLLQRVEAGELHPTGLLFGKGEVETKEAAFCIERNIIEKNPLLADGLIKFGLTQDRRTLRVFATDFQWNFQTESTVLLQFSLPAGSYATSLLREVVSLV